jgi:hypothetical protein
MEIQMIEYPIGVANQRQVAVLRPIGGHALQQP